MASPTGSVSDLLATASGAGAGTSSTVLDASTFIDPFSESNPFADDSLERSTYMTTSQSLNFGQYYPQSSTVPQSRADDDDNDDDDDDIGTTTTSNPGQFYGSNTLQGSFTALKLSGGRGGETGHDGLPTLSSSPYNTHQEQHDSDDAASPQRYTVEIGGHQRWSSVESINRYDSDDQEKPSNDSTAHRHVGHYRPGSMRSLGSQVCSH
jgi:hypothetical protein